MASPSKSNTAPPAGSPSPSPSKGKLSIARMSNLRRASTNLVKQLQKSASKSSLRDSTKESSLQKEPSLAKLFTDPTQAPPSGEETRAVVSPVAESPAREEAANLAESNPSVLRPSPLANVIVTEPTPQPSPGPSPTLDLNITASPEPIHTDLPSHPPVTTPEHFGFDDPIPTKPNPPKVESPRLVPQDIPTALESESASIPQSIPPPVSESIPPPASEIIPPPVSEAIPVPESVPPPVSEPVFIPVSEPVPSPIPQPASLPPPTANPEEPVPKVVEDIRQDRFAFSDPVVPASEPTRVVPVAAPYHEPEPVNVVSADDRAAESSYVHIPTESATFAWGEEAGVHSYQEPVNLSPPTRSLSGKVSRSSFASSFGQPLDKTRSGIVSERFTDDPFADQFGLEAPVVAAAAVEVPPVFQPAAEPEEESDTEESHIPESPTPMALKLPPKSEVIGTSASQSTRQPVASPYILGERDGASLAETLHPDRDERIPLLQHAALSARGGNGRATPNRGKMTQIMPSGPITSEMAVTQTLRSLGWEEHVLPDSSSYYHHRGSHITTDVDLRIARYLQHVTEYVERQLPRDTTMPPPPGWELWIKSASVQKNNMRTIHSWVNHDLRIITDEPPPTISGEGLIIERYTEDDKLDMEYRYWGFIEGHPAHQLIRAETRKEAMDALQWSYTDTLLPSARPAPPPFAPQECQELMNMLRSFDNSSTNVMVVQTRIVSRVLLRVAQWRQIYFRPNKPLPKDAIKGVPAPARKPFFRAITDLVIGCLCLGIPYLFINRTHSGAFDEESGLYSAGPMLMICACACLVAAVILSASVTLLSLPHVDDVPRVAGFVSIVCSGASMVSAVLALFRYKMEMDSAIYYLGGEGIMRLSRRSVIFSLPLVFLAWAIAAFMTGITLYSFRGTSVIQRGQINQPFAPLTHWAVVGTLGAICGMLTIATIFARR